jgi:23S rRNA pseudouridine1911/1915/1917 synthase
VQHSILPGMKPDRRVAHALREDDFSDMPDVLYEDNHCLALDKPAGLLVQGDVTGEPTLLDAARDYLRAKYHKPGNIFIGLVHRLDQPVSGVVLLARTSKAAARLSQQFREGTVRKVYLAVVEGSCPQESGEWTDRLAKDEAKNLVEVVEEDEEGKEARLAFRVLARGFETTTLELEPKTGRGHQLRVQLASRGLPIVGDRRYRARSRLRALDGGHRIALHAKSLTFCHPTRHEPVTITSSVPADWPASGHPG